MVLSFCHLLTLLFLHLSELWFFDNYIIPLAKKLKDCGVFGVSSDECLSYALMNREEWERKGEEVVARYVQTHSEQAEESETPSIATTAPSCVSDPLHLSNHATPQHSVPKNNNLPKYDEKPLPVPMPMPVITTSVAC